MGPEKEQIELKEGEEKKDETTEKGKKKKEKKEKKPKEPKEKGPNCIDVIAKDLNLGNRDSNNVNVEIDLDFDDVLAEPAAAQGFEFAWKLAFVLFSQTKLWILSPALRLLDLILAVVKKVVVGLIGATLGPVCATLGLIFGKSADSPV